MPSQQCFEKNSRLMPRDFPCYLREFSALSARFPPHFGAKNRGKSRKTGMKRTFRRLRKLETANICFPFRWGKHRYNIYKNNKFIQVENHTKWYRD